MDRYRPRALCAQGHGFVRRFDDGESAVLEPLLPPASPFGRPWKWPLRRLVDAMFYLLRHGLPRRMLPQDFPPMTTVQRHFHA